MFVCYLSCCVYTSHLSSRAYLGLFATLLELCVGIIILCLYLCNVITMSELFLLLGWTGQHQLGSKIVIILRNTASIKHTTLINVYMYTGVC